MGKKIFNEDRYVNPYTDFGFKKLFGIEMNKYLILSFINTLLHGKEKIKSLTYLNTEHLGINETDRRAVFDVYCENEKEEKILVEIQRREQQFFKKQKPILFHVSHTRTREERELGLPAQSGLRHRHPQLHLRPQA